MKVKKTKQSFFKTNLMPFLVVLGIFILHCVLFYYSNQEKTFEYVLASLIGGGFLIVELLYSIAKFSNKKRKMKMPNLSQRVWREHLVNHMIIPSLLYFTTVLFVWFNNIPFLKFGVLLFVSFVYIPLFINIHASYKNISSIDKETHYIFNVVRIMIVVMISDFLVNYFLSIRFGALFGAIIIFLLSFILIILMAYLQKQKSLVIYFYVFISSLVIGIVFFFLLSALALTLNPLSLSIIIGVVFFLMISYWHHKLEGSFDLYVFSEYMLMALIIVIILLGLKNG